MSTRKVHVVSLGCPKARVDTEVMVGVAREKGWELVGSPEEADAVVVNTCSFLQSAIDESVDVIDEMSALKKQSGGRLVVTGCLPSRFGNELAAELPDVDTFLGTSDLHRIAEALEGGLPDRSYIRQGFSHLYEDLEGQRMVTTRGATAFLKLAEGCNRVCTFCIIPQIRGKQRSRPIETVVAEARRLADLGIRELVLVAQDLTSYGTDLKDRRALVKLLRALEEVEGIQWIRLMYAYPWNFTDELLDHIRQSDKVVRYVDMPLQHVNERILKAMRRNTTRDAQKAVIGKLRDIEGMVLRTTFIAGFPGETDAEFAELVDWAEEVRFDRLGVFPYSEEHGTPAALMEGQVPEEVREARAEQLLQVQQAIHRDKMADLMGRDLQVLVDGASEEYAGLLEGRYYGQAPDIDGVVVLSIADPELDVRPGSMVTAHVTAHDHYDLVGTVGRW